MAPRTKSIPTEPAAKAPEAFTAAKPEKVRLDDSVLIRTKSNTFGQLVYINKRTGDRIEWSSFGEEQPISMGDLRAMRGTQNAFFTDNLIVITGCEDDRYPDLTPEDIYDALMVSKYYKNIIDPDHFESIFRMSEREIRERISMLSKNAKLNLVVALNKSIETGRLDSLRKIKLFEELLGCELAMPE